MQKKDIHTQRDKKVNIRRNTYQTNTCKLALVCMHIKLRNKSYTQKHTKNRYTPTNTCTDNSLTTLS